MAASDDKDDVGFLRRSVGVFAYSRRAMELVWTTSRSLTLILAVLTVVAGRRPESRTSGS